MPYGWRMLRAWCVGLVLCTICWLIVFAWRWPGTHFGRFADSDLTDVPRSTLLLVILFSAVALPPGLFPAIRFTGKARAAGSVAVLFVLFVLLAFCGGSLLRFAGDRVAEVKTLVQEERPEGDQEFEKYNAEGESVERAIIASEDDGQAVWLHSFRRADGKWYLIEKRPIPIHPGEQAFLDFVHAWLNVIVRGLPCGILFVLPAHIVAFLERTKENHTLRRLFLSGRGGSSRWAGPGTFKKYAATPKTPLNKSIPLGYSLFDDDFCGRPVVVHDDSHMLTIGMPGSGKSLTAIWPMLLTYKGSCIVVDPKGEHAKMTMDFRKTIGPTWLLDPFGVVQGRDSAGYNLFSEIDINHASARTMISAISSSCVNVSTGENKFWEENTRLILDGAIAHVLSTYPKDKHNLPYVADILMGFDPETGFADPSKFDELLIDMRTNSAAGGLPQMAAATLDELGDRAKGSVIAEMRTALKWCTDPAMRKQLTPEPKRPPHDVRLSDFGFNHRDRRTLYIALPFGAMVEQARWLRCLSELAMKSALRMRESNDRPSPPTVMVLDELPQYGKELQGIKEGMVTLRDAGMKLWPFVQNHQQLVDCFGEEGSKNFESGSTVQVFGVNDPGTAEWVSLKLGKHGIIKKTWKRWKFFFFRVKEGQEETDLVDAATITRELQQHQPLQYVFPTNGSPMRLQRRAFKTVTVGGQKFLGWGSGYSMAKRAGERS